MSLILWNRSSGAPPVLLLEGTHDALFFSRIGVADDVLLVVLGGHTKVQEVLDACCAMGLGAVLAVLDSDEAAFVGGPIPVPDVVCPDHADLEMMLVMSPAFDAMLLVWASETKCAGVDVRRTVLEIASEFSLLLRLSQLLELGLDFDEIEYSAYVNRITLALDMKRLILKVVANTAGCGLTLEGLEEGIAALRESGLPPESCANGHIAVQVVRRTLQRRFGSHEPKALDLGVLEKSLIVSYDPRDFPTTDMHAAIRRWEEREGCAVLV